MDWQILALVSAYVIIQCHYAECRVILDRDRDITTRGKTFQVDCWTEDEDLDGWYDKQGKKITSTAIFEKMYVQNHETRKNYQSLYVQAVKVADGGNYTCKGTENSRVFELYVEFYVTNFPTSIKMNSSEKAIIPCSAIGYPPPIYRWYRDWQRKEIVDSPRYSILSNGSLLIRNANVEDSSNYTCRIIQLQDTVYKRPREERKHIEVVVYGPPVLDTTKSTIKPVYSYKGNAKFTIECRWWGSPVPRKSITRPHGRGLLPETKIKGRSIFGDIRTEDDDDFGEYVCEASNFLGSRKHTILVKEADKPQAPTNISTVSYCSYITVHWNKPIFDGGLPITLYEIELLMGNVSKDDATTGSSRRWYTFNGGIVKPAAQYTVRVRGRNHAKQGQWAVLQITSDICPPSGVITITNRNTVLNTTSFQLTWTGPPNNGGDPNTNYVIEYSKMDKDGKYVHWTTIKDVSGTMRNITGLDKGSKYMFQVIAVNKRGRSKAGKKEFVVTDSAEGPEDPEDPEGKLTYVDPVYDVQINCTSLVIQVDLTLRQVPDAKLENFQLRDSSCTPVKQTNSHVTLRTRLDGCGTTSKHHNESVTYYNSVTARIEQSTSRMHIFEFPFSCTFIKRRTIGVPSFQVTKRVSVVEEGFGNFSFEMNLFKSALFQQPFDVSDYPVSVPMTKKLFAQTKLLSTDKNLEALTYTCVATPSANPNDKLQYLFIENGCVLDTTVTFKPIPGVTQKFQMLPFKFKDKSDSIVYLHCHVLVCHKDDAQSRCRKGCIRKRAARDVTVSRRSSLHRVTLGPIEVKTPSGKGKLERTGKRAGLSLGLVFVALFVSLALFAALVYAVRYVIVAGIASQRTPEKEPLEMSNVQT